jgi:hypothetical protein
VFCGKGASVVWQIEDEYGVEGQIESMGEAVWTNWVESVRPHLLEDPTPTNSNLKWDETFEDQVWIPDSNVYVTFETDNAHIYLLGTVDISDDST